LAEAVQYITVSMKKCENATSPSRVKEKDRDITMVAIRLKARAA